MTNFIFSEKHPMKPIRLRMTDSLIQDFNLYEHMSIIQGKQATKN